MLTLLNSRIESPIHWELVAGTFLAAREAALITKSLTEILVGEAALSLALILRRLSTDT